MIYNVYTALASLKPTQKWTWDGTDYSGLVWSDSGTAPTESEINAELTRLTNAEPMRLLRIEREPPPDPECCGSPSPPIWVRIGPNIRLTLKSLIQV